MDNDYQNSQWPPMAPTIFLSEAFDPSSTHSNSHKLSPLAELSILVTISGRAMTHHQISAAERTYMGPLNMWERHEWLENMLTRRMVNLMTTGGIGGGGGGSNNGGNPDPMSLFNLMVAHSIVIYMCNIVEDGGNPVWTAVSEQGDALVKERRKRAFNAAHEILKLAGEHDHIGMFKVGNSSLVLATPFIKLKRIRQLTQMMNATLGTHFHACAALHRSRPVHETPGAGRSFGLVGRARPSPKWRRRSRSCLEHCCSEQQ